MYTVRKYKIIFSLILTICVGVLLDLYVKSIIIVDPNYIFYTYSSLFTISAISITILTIVISFFPNKYYGFSVKEMLHFDSFGIRISHIVPVSFINIGIATLMLAINYINTVTISLFYILFLVGYYSEKIWQIVSNDSRCREIVEEELVSIAKSKDNKKIMNSIDNLFESYLLSIKQKELDISDYTIEIIRRFFKEIDFTDRKLGLYVDKKINDIFLELVPIMGYSFSIENVISLQADSKYSYFNARILLYKPIEKIRTYNDEKLLESSLVNICENIENIKCINSDEKIFILYQYFVAILENEIITLNYKNRLLESFFENITHFSWSEKNEYDLLREKVILYILRDCILLEWDDNIRTDLFLRLINNLSKDYIYEDCFYYFETLAFIYQALYFYSFNERETLKIEHRNKLKLLINTKVNNIDNMEVNFVNLFKKYDAKIISNLLNIAIKSENEYLLFEYFPKNFGGKAIVWSDIAGIDFAFKTYLIFYYHCGRYPDEIIINWDNLEYNEKELVISTSLDCFDGKTKDLGSNFLKSISDLSTWIGGQFVYDKRFIENLYDRLNKFKRELNDEKINRIDQKLPELQELNDSLKDYIVNKRKIFGYDNYMEIIGEDEIQFKPKVEEIESCNDTTYISQRICSYIGSKLNSIVKEKFNTIHLSLDKASIIKLLDVLKDNEYDGRNCTVMHYFLQNSDKRELPEFRDLEEKINSVKYYETGPISFQMFFKKDKLKFNIAITKYSLELLNDIECDKFSERFKMADGIYKIKGALYNKGQAMEMIYKIYRIQYITIKLTTNISKESGFSINYKY